MRLGAVADALYAECSREPFTGVPLHVALDSERRVHLTHDCTHAVGSTRPHVVDLADMHLHLRCPACATNVTVPEHLQHYGAACEDLARSRGALDETTAAHGIEALAGAVRALTFEAAAARAVERDAARQVDIERAGAKLRRRAWQVIDRDRESGSHLLRWAASFTAPAPQFDDQQERGAFEAARAGLRQPMSHALVHVLGAVAAQQWCDDLDGYRTSGPWSLCEVQFDGTEGALIAALLVQHPVSRLGRTFGVCPHWVAARDATLTLPLDVDGAALVGDDSVLQRHVELFAELSRRMPSDKAADVGRRLGRIRPTAFTAVHGLEPWGVLTLQPPMGHSSA